MGGANFHDNSNPIFRRLNLIKLTDLCNLNCLKYMYRIVNFDCNLFVKDVISKSQIEHGYATRTALLRLPTVRVFKYKQCIAYQGVQLWNQYATLINMDRSWKLVKKDLNRIINSSY